MLPVTSVFAAAAALMLIVLSMAVSFRRIKIQVDHGDGGDRALHRRIRAQGNFIEYVPICLILLGLLELRATPVMWLWGLGLLVAAGRLLHAAGTYAGVTPLRAAGMLSTMVSLAGGAVLLIVSLAGQP